MRSIKAPTLKAPLVIGTILACAVAATLAAAGPAFPLKPSANGRYLVDSTGQPFFYHADTVWVLPRKASLSVAEEYLDRRAKDGFTAVHFHTVSKEAGPVRNVNGDEPFSPIDDILKPNPAYWAHLDNILAAAEKRGLIVSLSALWIRWGGADREGWRAELTEQNARAYGQFLGARYASRSNLLWIVGGDANPGEKRAAVSLLAMGIKDKAPHHLLTVHNSPEHSSAAFFGREAWLDLNAAYTYREVHPPVLAEWNRPGVPRPIFLIESGYEDEGNEGRGGTPFRMRRQAYGAILSGALMGHAYGHGQLWRFSDQWREAASDTGSKQMRLVKEWFASRAWWKLEPDQFNELVFDGRGKPGDDDYVTAARATDGSFALAYLPKRRTIHVDLGRFPAPVMAAWFDPTDGRLHSVEPSPLENHGSRTFSPPEKNAAGESDWILILQAASASTNATALARGFGISGDRFTIGGQPTFLLGVSYFDALGWSHADLDALQARRFNLIRIFLDWSILAIKDGIPSPLSPRGFLNSDGSLKNTEALLNLVRACAARGIMVDVTILNAIYDAANPTSTILDMPSREKAVRNAVRLLKNEPNVFFDVCNEHNVAWNGKTTTLTHAEVAVLIRAALAEHPGAIVTVSSGGDYVTNERNVREQLDAGVMLVSPHFPREPDWFDRTDDRVKSVKKVIGALGRNVPVYLQEEQRRGWTKISPPKSEFLQAAREARDAGAAGWVFHTHAGFDLRSSNFLANLDSVEREVLDTLGTQVFGTVPAPAEESRMLRVHPTNPRYFTDGTKNPDGTMRAVYLTGSHTWNNRLDMGRDDPPEAFDFDAYLDFLNRRDHNFIRLWAWSSTLWDTRSSLQWVEQGAINHVAPQPWRRTGAGRALDGKPKFDLEEFEPAYFERLRARVTAAGRRGIYVSVMLFEGWTLSFDSTSWNGHPFRKENNVQGIDGDPNGDGKGLEIQTLTLPSVTRLQEAYVRKVIDTVNDLDNVLYEIANEARLLNPASSTKEWQYHLIRFIKNEEASRPKQHPVGMTSQGGGGGDDSAILRNSPADWISPNSDKFDYKDNPPANDSGKVVLLDTDHLWGVGGDAAWVWKSFLRGHNPLFMDPYDHLILGKGRSDQWEGARQAMGATRRLAARMDLASMTPLLDLASTKHCLAKPGQEYLVYQPATGEFSVNLIAGSYAFEWFKPTTGVVASTGSVKAAGGNQTFTPPFSGPAVLYLNGGANVEALPLRAGKAGVE